MVSLCSNLYYRRILGKLNATTAHKNTAYLICSDNRIGEEGEELKEEEEAEWIVQVARNKYDRVPEIYQHFVLGRYSTEAQTRENARG